MRKTEPITNLSMHKSNELISAKYKSTLLENQIMSIALTRIEVEAKEDDTRLIARLYPGELKRLVSDPAHIYRDLKKIAKAIVGHTMLLEDGKGNFRIFSIVPNADYINGTFVIEFNRILKDHILNLSRHYTTLELSMMTSFTRNSSFRLYELLKKDAYRINDSNPSVNVEYNISELRFIIGLANSDDDRVKRALDSRNDIDWDDLYDRLDKRDKKYPEWRDFNRRVIKPAQQELAEKSDIRFDYEGIRKGRTTKSIRFTIYKNEPEPIHKSSINKKRDIIEKNQTYYQLELPLDMYPELRSAYTGHNGLTGDDLTLLLQKADFNEQIVRDAIKMADEQPELSNYMGWIIRCIERGYTRTETLSGDADRARLVHAIKDNLLEYEDDVAERVWQKTRQKDDFKSFKQAVEARGLPMNVLEAAYDAKEKMDIYVVWKGDGYIHI